MADRQTMYFQSVAVVAIFLLIIYFYGHLLVNYSYLLCGLKIFTFLNSPVLIYPLVFSFYHYVD